VNPLKPIQAVLAGVKDENVDIKTYTLRVSDGYPDGSKPGQFNMLGYPGIGEAPISFSALSHNGEIGHTIRAAGMATRFLEKMEKGAAVLVRGPYGRGWPMEAAKGKDLVLLAGGIGLAPLRPVILEVMKQRADFGAVSVLFGARNENGLIYVDEYSAWQEAGISVLITVDELVTNKPWKHQVGLITGPVASMQMEAGKTVCFICGPEIMMRFVCRGLMLKGLPAADLYVSLERRMKCGIAQCGHCQHAGLFVCKDGPVFSYPEIAGLYDGML
jgi:sulfhydrogenase subunit gamma (sulfur reductase)